MDVRIGIIQSMKELEIELDDTVQRDTLEAEFAAALAADQIVWLTDRKGRRVGVPAARVQAAPHARVHGLGEQPGVRVGGGVGQPVGHVVVVVASGQVDGGRRFGRVRGHGPGRGGVLPAAVGRGGQAHGPSPGGHHGKEGVRVCEGERVWV